MVILFWYRLRRYQKLDAKKTPQPVLALVRIIVYFIGETHLYKGIRRVEN